MYERKCNHCNTIIIYKSKYRAINSTKLNLKCRKCRHIRRINPPISDETRRKISESSKNRKYSDEFKLKQRLSKLGKQHSEESKLKMSIAKKNMTNETKEKMRISALENMKKRYPNYKCNHNSLACKIIEEYANKHGYKFQHAENGGEVCVAGYYLDGYDNHNKIIIEYNERYHKTPKQQKRDKIRNKRIIEILNPTKFIILWETADGYEEEIIKN